MKFWLSELSAININKSLDFKNRKVLVHISISIYIYENIGFVPSYIKSYNKHNKHTLRGIVIDS